MTDRETKSDSLIRERVARCTSCDRIWTEQSEAFQLYPEWSFCPYCGGDLDHEEVEYE